MLVSVPLAGYVLLVLVFAMRGGDRQSATLPTPTEYLAAFLARTATQGTIWFVFLCFLVLNPPRLRDSATLLASVVLLGLAGWAGSIYITRMDVNELAKGSGERLLMTLIPIATFYCAVHPLLRERLLGRPKRLSSAVTAFRRVALFLCDLPDFWHLRPERVAEYTRAVAKTWLRTGSSKP